MRTIGTASEVVDAFVEGRELRTALDQVPGGRRVRSEKIEGRMVLLSYRTEVAFRSSPSTIRANIEAQRIGVIGARGPAEYVDVTTRKYSTTTSRLLGRLRQALMAAGYRPTGNYAQHETEVPGRWGGFGPAWAPSNRQVTEFEEWSR